MAAAGIGGGGDHDLPLEEVDAVLTSFSGDPAAAFALLPAPAAAAASRELVVAGESLREGLGDVEKFLMQDYEDEALLDGVDEFLDGILVEDGEGEGSPRPKPTGEKSADRACAGEDEVAVVVDCGDDPNSKKKLRQMRNRDSAMKSREKKKLYVKDLEMKSKYLEAECCRLSYALQCCTAENMALRQSLLKDRHAGAPTATQESAELTDTLLLCQIPSSILSLENLPSSTPEPESDADTRTRVHVTLVPHVKLEMQKQNPAAGFPAVASEHLVPIPGGRHAQQKPGGSKKPRKRSCKAGQDINKRCKDDQNDK